MASVLLKEKAKTMVRTAAPWFSDAGDFTAALSRNRSGKESGDIDPVCEAPYATSTVPLTYPLYSVLIQP